jgi:hypothetical protein
VTSSWLVVSDCDYASVVIARNGWSRTDDRHHVMFAYYDDRENAIGFGYDHDVSDGYDGREIANENVKRNETLSVYCAQERHLMTWIWICVFVPETLIWSACVLSLDLSRNNPVENVRTFFLFHA